MIFMSLAIFTILTQTLLTSILGFRWGAPLSACETMRPQHGYTPVFVKQESDSPFVITLDYSDDLSSYFGVQKIRKVVARIHSKNPGETFKGFMIMVQNKQQKIFGRFQKSDDYQLMDCFKFKRSCATHNDAIPMTYINITWLPPRKPVLKRLEMYFIATVVKNMEQSWTGVMSKTFKVMRRALHKDPGSYPTSLFVSADSFLKKPKKPKDKSVSESESKS